MRKLVCLIPLLLTSNFAWGDVFQFVDEGGKKHFVDKVEKVPPQFRGQLGTQKELPPISRSQPGREKLYEKDSYASEPQGKQIEIFVTSWCPHCKELESYLQQRKLAFTRYDIEESREGRDKYEQLGGGGVPIVRIGTTTLRGFNPNRVDAALELNR